MSALLRVYGSVDIIDAQVAFDVTAERARAELDEMVCQGLAAWSGDRIVAVEQPTREFPWWGSWDYPGT